MHLPQHLAIIMDGNGRWAEQRRKPRYYGHVRGTRVAKTIIEECVRLGIPHLTLYAFSTENWFRPQSEVSTLMRLLKKYLQREARTLVQENVRFDVIGDLSSLPKDVQDVIQFTKEVTSSCTGLKLTFALSYGSRQEITKAVQSLAQEVASGRLAPQAVTEELVSKHLQTHFLPDPDMILRTSGEHRLSNFLLWQAAYSEFFFSPKLWPDFTCDDLAEVLASFAHRERRFGRTEKVLPHEQLNH